MKVYLPADSISMVAPLSQETVRFSIPDTCRCTLHTAYMFRWTESLKKVLKKGLKKVTELKKVLKKVMKLKKGLKKVNSLKKALKKVMNLKKKSKK